MEEEVPVNEVRFLSPFLEFMGLLFQSKDIQFKK